MDKMITISDDIVAMAQEATGEKDERAAIETLLKRIFSGRRKNNDLMEPASNLGVADGSNPKTGPDQKP